MLTSLLYHDTTWLCITCHPSHNEPHVTLPPIYTRLAKWTNSYDCYDYLTQPDCFQRGTGASYSGENIWAVFVLPAGRRILCLHLATLGRMQTALSSAQEYGWARFAFHCLSSTIWNTKLRTEVQQTDVAFGMTVTSNLWFRSGPRFQFPRGN